MRRWLVVAAYLAALHGISAAQAQSWPARPVTMIYPYGAGSGGDPVGRVLASRLTELLGQPVVFENIAGARGMLGAAHVAKAPPDGYLFLISGAGSQAMSQTLYKKPLYNTATDFTPVALLAEQPMVMIVRKDLPVDTLQAFIAYAREHQAQMQYGSPGPGSVAHLACALLTAAIGVKVLHVAYRGGGGALQDLIAGRIDFQCPVIGLAIPHIESRTVKALAVFSKDRAPVLPDVPSAHEQGVTDFEVTTWYAMFFPKGTPAPIVQRLHDAASTAVETPAVQARLRETGATVVAPERRSPEYLQKFVEREIAKWAVPIKASGVQLD